MITHTKAESIENTLYVVLVSVGSIAVPRALFPFAFFSASDVKQEKS